MCAAFACVATSVQAQTDTAALAAYNGVYRLEGKGAFTFVAQDGQLYGRLTGQPFMPLTAAAPDVFTFPGAGAEFTFTREQGKVAAVTLRQRGAVLEGQRTGKAPPAQAMDPAVTQEAFGGAYVSAMPPLNFSVQARAGQLTVKLNEQPALPVFAMEGRTDRFAYDVVTAEMQFERDAGGKVTGLVLYQNGQVLRAARQVHAAP
nr:DUF3471 domain-containing protein [Pseudoduganella ginsengisoli]